MRVLLLVVLAGCWTGLVTPATMMLPPSEPTAKPELVQLACAQVVGHALDVSKDELTRTAKPEQIERIRVAVIESCVAQRWSQELLGCFQAATSSDELGGCQPKMTRTQSDDMQKRMIEAIQADLPQNPCGGP